jgi:hypothetical protein
MSKLSCSFTLGKLSAGQANVEHNLREKIADNVDVARIDNNVIYVQDDVREVYDELFGDALEAYNSKQTRRDRKIHDYFEHIENGDREEAYYEAVVQFGCIKSAPIGSSAGEVTKKMLDEYMKGFEARNKNLRVFCSVLHADETCYHLHINFIPFYTQGRQKGLSKGVSMKAALIEQGFKPKNGRENQLVMWEKFEMSELEKILNRFGLNRNVKRATHDHMTVPEFKKSVDEKKLTAVRWEKKSPEILQQENSLLKIEKDKLIAEKHSPYMSFYYSSPEKQSFVVAELDRLGIPYRESENGFEAKRCYVTEIRNIEKQYKTKSATHREELQEHIDTFLMRAKDFDDMLRLLREVGYTVKPGKYISVMPRYGDGYIRLKSLGVYYSEDAIRNRIISKHNYANELNRKIAEEPDSDSLNVVVNKTIRHYTIIFAQGYLPTRKINKKKPFSWENDAELDKLASLNKKITEGVTLETLRKDFIGLEYNISRLEQELKPLEDSALGSRLYNIGYNYFTYGRGSNEELMLLVKHGINTNRNGQDPNTVSYKRVPEQIEQMKSEIEQSLSEVRVKFKDISETLTTMERVVNGTFIKSLVEQESHRRQSKYVQNGLKPADVSQPEPVQAPKPAYIPKR